ncbi:hypothetical protein IAT40_005418 [Kwoniella sp. CBS 6097]
MTRVSNKLWSAPTASYARLSGTASLDETSTTSMNPDVPRTGSDPRTRNHIRSAQFDFNIERLSPEDMTADPPPSYDMAVSGTTGTDGIRNRGAPTSTDVHVSLVTENTDDVDYRRQLRHELYEFLSSNEAGVPGSGANTVLSDAPLEEDWHLGVHSAQEPSSWTLGIFDRVEKLYGPTMKSAERAFQGAISEFRTSVGPSSSEPQERPQFPLTSSPASSAREPAEHTGSLDYQKLSSLRNHASNFVQLHYGTVALRNILREYHGYNPNGNSSISSQARELAEMNDSALYRGGRGEIHIIGQDKAQFLLTTPGVSKRLPNVETGEGVREAECGISTSAEIDL